MMEYNKLVKDITDITQNPMLSKMEIITKLNSLVNDYNISNNEFNKIVKNELTNIKNTDIHILGYCYYCKRPIYQKHGINNAEDYELHEDTKHKICCPKCNYIVTESNRLIKRLIDIPNIENVKLLKDHIFNINNFLDN